MLVTVATSTPKYFKHFKVLLSSYSHVFSTRTALLQQTYFALFSTYKLHLFICIDNSGGGGRNISGLIKYKYHHQKRLDTLSGRSNRRKRAGRRYAEATGNGELLTFGKEKTEKRLQSNSRQTKVDKRKQQLR